MVQNKRLAPNSWLARRMGFHSNATVSGSTLNHPLSTCDLGSLEPENKAAHPGENEMRRERKPDGLR
jgi:hypothetical protein